MPALITHYAFALEVLGQDDKHQDMALLSSQGPDHFFFYGKPPFVKRKAASSIQNYGKILHQIDISDLYCQMIEIALTKEKKELLLSFVKGLFIHYIVDRNCHPYVFSFSGCGAKEEEERKKQAGRHSRLESAIDILVGERNGCYSKNLRRYFSIGENDLKEVSELFFEANRKTLNLPLFPDSYQKSVKDYRSTMIFLNEPYRLKRWFLKAAMGSLSVPFALNYPRNLLKTYGEVDFLNAKKSAWPDPVTNDTHHESFDDLLKKSKKDYEAFLPLFHESIRQGGKKDDIKRWVNGINHLGAKENESLLFSSPLSI